MGGDPGPAGLLPTDTFSALFWGFESVVCLLKSSNINPMNQEIEGLTRKCVFGLLNLRRWNLLEVAGDCRTLFFTPSQYFLLSSSTSVLCRRHITCNHFRLLEKKKKKKLILLDEQNGERSFFSTQSYFTCRTSDFLQVSRHNRDASVRQPVSSPRLLLQPSASRADSRCTGRNPSPDPQPRSICCGSVTLKTDQWNFRKFRLQSGERLIPPPPQTFSRLSGVNLSGDTGGET